MARKITIRDVPDAVHDELAARAARRGMSIQAYLRAELEPAASSPLRVRNRGRTLQRLATQENVNRGRARHRR
jgi:plasmid stability protein